jgi:hypothetical protein
VGYDNATPMYAGAPRARPFSSLSRAGAAATQQSGGATAPAAPFTQDMMDVVGRLSGAVEISPGVKLRDRYTAQNKDTARTFLQGEFAKLGMTPQLQKYGASGANVYATLPSTNGSKETIVVGAHFDSVRGGPGANDNATGTAMVLAAAKDLAALKDRNVNVVFVLFDEEEKGLIGSDRFAKMLKDQKVPVTSVHTVDQMGWDADGDRAIELELPDGKLAELYETAAREAGLNVPLEVTRTDTSDHQSFRKYGFQAIGLTEEYVNGDTTPYYHTPRDTYATVNWDYLTSSTRLFDAVLEKLVKPAAPPPPPPPEEPDLDDWYRNGCD